MSATFDTSGCIRAVNTPRGVEDLEFCDLSPFTQGYVEAMFSTMSVGQWQGSLMGPNGGVRLALAFSDLAPETLARIMEDCAEGADGRRGGRLFYEMRQAVKFSDLFPPLTPYLGDDGKVYLRA